MLVLLVAQTLALVALEAGAVPLEIAAQQAALAQTGTSRTVLVALAEAQPVSTSVACPTSHSRTTERSKAAQRDTYGHLQKLRVVQAVDTAVQEVRLSDATQDKTKGCEMPSQEMVKP